MESNDQPTLALQHPPDAAIPPRPKSYEKHVRRAAAEMLWPEILEWLRQCGEPVPDEHDRETMLKEMEDAVSPGYDGYEIVKNLERSMYFSGDAKLVEIMDGACWKLGDAHRRMCRDWVKAYQPLAPAIGTKVKWPKCNKENPGVGTVYEVHADGTASVKFPDLGHGVLKNGCGTMGSILAWEDIVDEPDQPPRTRYVEPPPKPKEPETLKLSGGMKTIPIEKPSDFTPREQAAVSDFVPADFTPRETAMLTALRMIAHAVAPGDDGYHENAYELSTDAISAATGEKRPW